MPTIAKMFSEKEQNLWKDAKLSLQLIYKKKARQARKDELIKFLKKFPVDKRGKLVTLLKIKVAESEDAIQSLLKNEKTAIELSQLMAFFKSHKAAISSFFRATERGTYVKNELIIPLTENYVKDPEFLIGITYFSEWNSGVPERRYKLAELKDEDIKNLSSKMKTLVSSLNRGETEEERKYHKKKTIQLEGYYFFPILRGKLKEVKLGHPKNRIITTAILKLIILNTETNEIYIVIHKTRELKKIINFLIYKVKLKFSRIKTTEETSIQNVKKFLLGESQNFGITRMKLTHTELPDSPTVDILNNGLSIKGAVNELEKTKAVDLTKLANVRKLTVTYNNYDFNFSFIKKLGHYNIILTDKWPQRKNREELNNAFYAEFGFKPNSFLKIKEEQADKQQLAQEILKNQQINLEELAEDEREIISTFIEQKLLEKPEKSEAIWICTNPRDTKGGYFRPVRKGGACRYCKAPLKLEGTELPLKPNEKGIKQFIKKNLQANSLKIQNLPLTLQKKKYWLFYVFDDEGRKILVYVPNKSTVQKEIIDKITDENIPLAVVKKVKDTESNNLEQKDISVISLTNLLYDNLTQLFKTIVAEQSRKYKQRIVSSADSSAKRLKKIVFGEYDEDKFEIDIFNVLHEILPNAERLGTKMKGKEILDSIAALQFKKKKRIRYCIAWDAKYSESEKGYKLSNPGKQKTYLKKLLPNEKIKFFGGLRLHLIITNNMKADVYNNFIKKAKYRKFNGKFALITVTPILKLWEFYKQNENKFETNQDLKNDFMKEFHKLFFSTNKKIVIIGETQINQLISNLKSKVDKVNPIQFERKDFNKQKT